MKVYSIIKKSIKEQVRSFWILLLTVSMAPFFVMIYYLINESEKPSYDIVIVNHDSGLMLPSGNLNYGEMLLEYMESIQSDTLSFPVNLAFQSDRSAGIEMLKKRKADALIVIPEGFTRAFNTLQDSVQTPKIGIEFVGDLTNYDYMICAVWTGEILDQSVFYFSGFERPFEIKETFLGASGNIDDFDYYIPGILVISIIMLMFTASIALIMEVENKTILRLKMSRIGSIRLLAGISIVQLLIGIISVIITFLVAILMGFDYSGSIAIFLIISALTSLSIISFSLVVAGITKTVNEILIVGNFPLFLFMFFTGAAFPINGKELFSVAGYSFTIQGLMSPTHAISALRKTLILDMEFRDVLPEIFFLVFLTVLYFLIGVWIFRRRHMKVN